MKGRKFIKRTTFASGSLLLTGLTSVDGQQSQTTSSFCPTPITKPPKNGDYYVYRKFTYKTYDKPNSIKEEVSGEIDPTTITAADVPGSPPNNPLGPWPTGITPDDCFKLEYTDPQHPNCPYKRTEITKVTEIDSGWKVIGPNNHPNDGHAWPPSPGYRFSGGTDIVVYEGRRVT